MQANVHCASSGADVDTSNSITSLARNNDSILDPIQSSGIQHVMEKLGESAYEVEFCGDDGRTYAMLGIREDDLMILHYSRVEAA